MKRVKEFEVALTSRDVIDVRIVKDGGEVTGFVLNLRCVIAGMWRVVYRVDTAHGYLHEQRFWLSPEPIKLPMMEGMSLRYLFNYFINSIRQNFERFRKYYERKSAD